MDDAIERAQKYVEAGADCIFPEALQNEQEFKHFSAHIKAPLLANMTEFGKTPYYSADEFEQWGFDIVIYPVSSLRVAAKAYEKIFSEIFEKGTQKEVLDQMQSRKELYETIRYYDYEDLDGKIARTILPNLGIK